ncbi:YebC-like protein [Dendrothele bispora CBS 962.96]|uniref:YebC-like protein n=1 Tax=Dendrothele bispora (strain CBS 962.96) TaxID=1314807 RepID=A0A4S8MVR2_DENBC|nr:YebC-like protein [Dendrothele bispora CBS 962.96]
MLHTLRTPLRSRSQTRYLHYSYVRCAGHNKWSKIKDKKGANDASKSAVYSRARIDIINAARIGGSIDPDSNVMLNTAIKRIKSQGVPKENIAKALAQASKEKGGGEILTYEAIACNSIGIIIECTTDNVKRTVQGLREILTSKGARLAPVGFMFQRSGSVKVTLDKGDDFDQRLEKLVEIALDNGAEDFEQLPEGEGSQIEVEFKCEPSSLSSLTDALLQVNSHLVSSELAYKPLEQVEPSSEDAEALSDLVDALEAHEDTVRVWTSCS